MEDIVERLRSYEVFLMDGGISPVAEIAAQEIERLHQRVNTLDEHVVNLRQQRLELRETLCKIAAVNNERLPTPSTPEEGVLWVTLISCVDLAIKALEGE